MSQPSEPGGRLRAVPAWIWLSALVLVSFAVRALLARSMPGPFIMVDELIYSELARSFAESGEFLVRDVPTSGYSLVYPVLISPAYAVFERLTDAYAAVKTINALVMSLAAIPAYLLARRVVDPLLALLGAVLAVAVPSFVYTGTVMTESVFYPVFLTVALLFVLALERPTGWRQLALLVAIAVAWATRVQAVALLPALLTAPFLLALFRRQRLSDALRPFRWLYLVVVGGALVVLAVQLVRGRSLSDLFGAYSVVGDRQYDLAEVARYFAYHVGELDLYLGVVPVAATIVLAGISRSQDRALQAFLAGALTMSFWLVLAVAAFASEFALRIQERNMFVVAPLFFTLLLAWVERGAPRPRALTVGAAAAAAALVLLVPFERFITTSAVSDTLMLLPWWNVQDHVTLEWVAELALVLAAALAAAFVLVPRRRAIVLPLIVLAYYAAVFYPIWGGEHGVREASRGAVFQGIRGVERDWIDTAVSRDADVSVLWQGVADRLVVNQNEFFNRAVGQVYYTVEPTPGGIGEIGVEIDPRDGVVRDGEGAPVVVDHVLAPPSVTPDGVLLARDELLGTSLWRVNGELVSTTRVDGLYPNDSWSGERVTWTRRRCRGGELTVWLSSDPSLFTGAQTVTASIGREEVARVLLDPRGEARLRVPLPDDAETCVVRFAVSPTAVPADVMPGSEDDRVLGAHFNVFAYEPQR